MQVQQRTKDSGAALAALYRFSRDGLVVHLGSGVFAPVRNTAGAGARAGGSVFATAGDAEASNGKEDPCDA